MTAQPTRPNRSTGLTGDAWRYQTYRQDSRGADRASATPRRGTAAPHPYAHDRAGWERDSEDTGPQQEEPTPGRGGCVVAALVLAALFVLCVTGALIAQLLLSDSTPTLPPVAGQTSAPLATDSRPQATRAAGESGPTRVDINPTQGYVNSLITATGQGWWPGEPVFLSLRAPGEEEGPGYAYAAAVADDRGNFHTAFTFPNEMRWMNQAWADVIARGSRSELEATTRFTLIAPTPTNTSPLPTARPTSDVTETPTPTASLTPSPTSTPTPDVVIADWRGEYFTNPALSGPAALVRNDVAVGFNWGAASPDPGIPVDYFSARWTRELRFSEGAYRISVTADDGVRFWMDGQLLIDEWHDASGALYTVDVYASKGQHSLHLEYYEGVGGAMVQFQLTKPEEPTATHTPTSTPTPGPTATPTPTRPPSATLPSSWQAAYYDNPRLFGEPALVRLDAAVSFDWGAGSPDPSLPNDGFSARWTGEAWLSGGSYRYFLTVDDGARLSIDGQPLIFAWSASPGHIYSEEIFLAQGLHTFVVEYSERTGNANIHVWSE